MVTCTGHIGIHEGEDGRTDVHDFMAIKPNFLTSMGYHIFLTMVLRAACLRRARSSAKRSLLIHASLSDFIVSSMSTIRRPPVERS